MIRYNLADSQIAAGANLFRGKQNSVSLVAARLRNHPLDSLDRISMRYPAGLDDRVNSTDSMVGFQLEQLGLSDWSEQSGRYGLISVPRED